MKKRETYPEYIARKDAGTPKAVARRKAGKALAKKLNEAQLKKRRDG